MALPAEEDLVLLALPGYERGLEVEVVEPGVLGGRFDHGRDLRVIAVVVAGQVLRVGQQHDQHRHAVLARLRADLGERRAHCLPAARARAVVAGPVVLGQRATAGVLDAQLVGRVHPGISDLLLQRAARPLQELTQIKVLGQLVERQQEGMQVAQRLALLVRGELVVRVVDRVVVHEHEVG
ncbi:MAG TPA: hypothetical protein VMR50_17540 [Myxococcota bacterium]|nr:hypothetical protein [Myxococcota bacterium]